VCLQAPAEAPTSPVCRNRLLCKSPPAFVQYLHYPAGLHSRKESRLAGTCRACEQNEKNEWRPLSSLENRTAMLSRESNLVVSELFFHPAVQVPPLAHARRGRPMRPWETGRGNRPVWPWLEVLRARREAFRNWGDTTPQIS
jgi:hypothetical protein